MVEDATGCADADLPYLFQANFYNCAGARFLRSGIGRSSLTLSAKNLDWPEQLRLPGQNIFRVAERWKLELCNAFGSRRLIE